MNASRSPTAANPPRQVQGLVGIKTLDPEIVDLVARAQHGDDDAFALLYDRYVEQVHAYIHHKVRDRHLAEDLTADVFLRALRGLSSFRWQGVDIGAWLTTIARNRVTDHFKSARVRLEHVAEEIADRSREDPPDHPESLAVAQDLAALLDQAMHLLKDDHREVVSLRFVQDLSVAETAAVMRRTEGAVKALQYRALRALADIVRDHPALSGEPWSRHNETRVGGVTRAARRSLPWGKEEGPREPRHGETQAGRRRAVTSA
ncbi:MAG: sigma-70 family RNA polymerase sigma factor [Actinomycetota bacterium]|nr:sigma-70 family RNA polymerase sigma factor [Actinomycetota bacterium]